MEKIKLILLLPFIFYSSLINAQWIQKNSGTINHLYDIHFPTADVGYAVGYYGTILKSTDAGETWTALNIDPQCNLNAVRFVNRDTGFTVGDSIIFKTTDGGLNWTKTILSNGTSLYDIKFIDDTTGFCVGSPGYLLKTTDGGASWVPKSAGSYINLSHISFPVRDTGYISLDAGRGFLKSIDGGETWNWFPLTPITDVSNLDGIYFTSTSNGIIAGWYDAYLLKTTDGGNSWGNKDTIDPVFINSVYFPSASNGYAVGWYGRIIHSTDGGDNWADQNSGVSYGAFHGRTLYSVYFIDDHTGFVVGDSGTILKTSNSGVGIVEEKSQDLIFNIYPNPTNEVINISVKNSKNNCISIYNLLGEEVYSGMFNGIRATINCKLAGGVYYIQLTNSEENRTKKLLIE